MFELFGNTGQCSDDGDRTQIIRNTASRWQGSCSTAWGRPLRGSGDTVPPKHEICPVMSMRCGKSKVGEKHGLARYYSGFSHILPRTVSSHCAVNICVGCYRTCASSVGYSCSPTTYPILMNTDRSTKKFIGGLLEGSHYRRVFRKGSLGAVGVRYQNE